MIEFWSKLPIRLVSLINCIQDSTGIIILSCIWSCGWWKSIAEKMKLHWYDVALKHSWCKDLSSYVTLTKIDGSISLHSGWIACPITEDSFDVSRNDMKASVTENWETKTRLVLILDMSMIVFFRRYHFGTSRYYMTLLRNVDAFSEPLDSSNTMKRLLP